METTSVTLLERVRNRRDDDAWKEFHRIYAPLIARYAHRRGLGRADAEEIAQDCMQDLARAMPNFVYARQKGRFKAYVKTVADHRIDRWLRRPRPSLASQSRMDRLRPRLDPEAAWDRLWLREHLLYCLGVLESKSVDSTIRAFRLYALEDWPVEKVCGELDLTPNQVYLAKSRMTRRLRKAMRLHLGDVL
jgi:RNA polymerase sigma-70 factor (ECF subfamily)